MDAPTLVDYAASLDCIHCGLCLNACPTYRLTGNESSSPRGRVYLMRGVAEGRLDPANPLYAEELDFCLVCRGCESACPAGVRFGEMMEYARDTVEQARPRSVFERFARTVAFRWWLPNRLALRASMLALAVAQRIGLTQLAAVVGGVRGRALAAFPKIPWSRPRLPERTPARGEARGNVAVLEGCVMPDLFGRVNRASVRVLAEAGFESRCAREHVCCGALHAHNGDLEGARDLARKTIKQLDLKDNSGEPLPVVVNSAGCGAHMREYGRLLEGDAEWRERAESFAERVVDFGVFLAREAGEHRWPAAQAGTCKTVYDDPCHLCHAQQIRAEPRELLDRVDGIERVELQDAERCCGSAGIYSLLRPQDSADVLAPKLDAVERSGAEQLVTANPGCHLQWETGLRQRGSPVRVRHLAEVLAAGLRDAPPVD